MITGGFGMTMDLTRGTMRQWVMGRDGVKRWADTNDPVTQPTAAEAEDAFNADQAKIGGMPYGTYGGY